MKTILKNGRILDPSQDIDIVGNLVIEDGQITELGPETSEDGADEVYECRGLWITPGLVDLDCRLREPGQDQRETIKTGTAAAAAGGYTTICTMPDTSPALDSPAFVDFILDRAANPDAGGVFVAPVGALTIGQMGEKLAPYSSLKKAGIVAVSDEGGPTQTAGVMLRAMEHCLQIDLPIMVHCEDLSLSGGGSMNDGAVSAMLGLKGIPRSAEEAMIHRNCVLALTTGCRIHILRVSTWGSVEAIRHFKELGAPITCEVLPPHFSLTEDSVGEFDPHFKAAPPLRTSVDMEIIQQALAEGVIDCIASGHAPFAGYEVDVPFDEAPSGFSALESALGVTLTNLTQKGILSPLETIRRMSTTPAEILRLEAGSLKPGSSPLAQVILIDPNVDWTFDVHRTFSRGKNSPFHRSELQGKSVVTFVGTEIYRDPLFEEGRYSRA